MMKSVKKIALIVSLGTLLSKLGGLIRQLLIAGSFGIGASYDAYNYAYILPGFFLVLLGGVNGPFHNSIVSVLSKKDKEERALIINTVQFIVTLSLLIISLVIFLLANQIINFTAPGLNEITHKVAVIQLKVMAPIVLFSGLIGISFGSLNSIGEFLIPSISPIFSSITIIFFIGIFWLQEKQLINNQEIILKGGLILGVATLLGAIFQWGIQLPTLIKKKILNLNSKIELNNPGVKEVWRILGPATLSSGMLQINVFSDLFFASNIIGAAAGLGYANFLIQAPLGIISNALIIPLIPVFSKLSLEEDKSNLKRRIRQSLIISAIFMFWLGSIFIAFSKPITILIYGRGAFNNEAIDLVSKLLIAYGVGMPVYLGRDLLVRIFYSLGDAKTPFRISILGIILNILFDWVLIGSPSPWGQIFPINLGAQGLIYATVSINLFSSIYLLIQLSKTIKGLGISKIVSEHFKILFSGILTIIFTFIATLSIQFSSQFIELLIQITLLSAFSTFIFIVSNITLGVQEIKDIVNTIMRKFILP